jgi:hypothetical protein
VKPFTAHLRRHELENRTEKFASVPEGTFAEIYTRNAIRQQLGTPGWLRIWVIKVGQDIVAHASLYCLQQPDDVSDRICYGHIGIERPWRSRGLYGKLQASRLGFCDANGLTLVGAVALGNDNAWFAHRRYGYEFLKIDLESKSVWMFRPPRDTISACGEQS